MRPGKLFLKQHTNTKGRLIDSCCQLTWDTVNLIFSSLKYGRKITMVTLLWNSFLNKPSRGETREVTSTPTANISAAKNKNSWKMVILSKWSLKDKIWKWLFFRSGNTNAKTIIKNIKNIAVKSANRGNRGQLSLKSSRNTKTHATQKWNL